MLEVAAVGFIFELGIYLAFLIRKEIFEHRKKIAAEIDYLQEELPPTQWPVTSEDS